MPHKHSQNGNWQRRHRLWRKVQDEVKRVYDTAWRDPELGETISLRESVLLDVDQGEVLRTPTYSRSFDVLFRR